MSSSDIATLVFIALFALAAYLIIRSQRFREDFNDDQWRRWWDRIDLPDEPPPDGGLDLPKSVDSKLVSAVAGARSES